jgi:hypothetical protein
VFVSSDIRDIPAGSRWLEEIEQALGAARVLLVVCSPLSLTRPWINVETGCALIKRVPVVPVCHSGQQRSQLPPPLSTFQALEVESPTFVSDLLASLAHLRVRDGVDTGSVLATAAQLLRERHRAGHATLQVEPAGHEGCDELTW